jgi:hypothetical protein
LVDGSACTGARQSGHGSEVLLEKEGL